MPRKKETEEGKRTDFEIEFSKLADSVLGGNGAREESALL
jgi:hypothetical protein